MISFEDYSVTYDGAEQATLRSVDLEVTEGEFALLVGRTGCGKSTLLRSVNGLVPHFTGGHVEGRVRAGGRDPRHHAPREFADTVGVVGQDPLAGFVTDTVEEELAYGMEQLAIAPQVMRRRVEEVLDLMGIAPLRRRALRSLSGGEQQRVAVARALIRRPKLILADEPTGSLDSVTAGEVMALLRDLHRRLGVTILMVTHDRDLAGRCDRRIEMLDGRIVHDSALA